MDFFYVDTLRRLKKEQKMELKDIEVEMNKKIKKEIKKGWRK